ncbi:MAG: hypothetical protein FD134_1862 [Gallionellaceae bacterium]|nr:MAG: hypothetical protein FD134_1862 [Gallionellaceae bacterium]
MKSKFFGVLALVALLFFTPFAATAATPNYAVGISEQVISFHISGQYTASTTGVVKFTLPYPVKLVGVSATARASGGTSPTLTVDVLEGGASVLSAPVSITAGTVGEGTITDAALADEAAVTVNLAIGGTSPTWNDITVLLTVVRK